MKRKTYIKNRTGGQAMIMLVVLFLFISIQMTLSVSGPVLNESRYVRHLYEAERGYFLSEGSSEDVLYRLNNGMELDSVETLVYGDTVATTTIVDIGAAGKKLLTSGENNRRYKKAQMDISLDTEVSFSYGVQVGAGGFSLENSASILGNVYSNGPIVGTNSNTISGTAISAGPSGLIDGVFINGFAYANTITDSQIQASAYYQNISSSVVLGTQYASSTNQNNISLPIPDALIDGWEGDASSGTVISSPCPYVINSNTTIGPAKINCDLEISGNPTVTVAGSVWVDGDITIKNSPIIQVDPSLGVESVVIIADDTVDDLNSGIIDITNSTVFSGSGSPSSYIMLLSRNNSAELGGGVTAIHADNSVSGDLLLYAGSGEIKLGNSVSLKEVTAYKISLENTAQVIYETGLASLLFNSTATPKWGIRNWVIVQ